MPAHHTSRDGFATARRRRTLLVAGLIAAVVASTAVFIATVSGPAAAVTVTHDGRPGDGRHGSDDGWNHHDDADQHDDWNHHDDGDDNDPDPCDAAASTTTWNSCNPDPCDAAASTSHDDSCNPDPCEAEASTATGAGHDDSCNPPPPPKPQPQPAAAPAPAPVNVVAVKPAKVYDGILACGGSADVAGQLSAPEATVTRLTDADKTDASECADLPYSLYNADNELEFLKPATEPYAQFIVDVTWKSMFAEPVRPQTYLDFGLVPGGYELPMPTCPASLRDASGKLVGLPAGGSLTPSGLAALGITDQDGLPGATATDNHITQYACVGAQSARVVFFPLAVEPYSLITEQIFLLGDIFIRR